MKGFQACITIFLLALAVTASAQSTQTIVWVDMKSLLDRAPQVEAGRARLDQEFRPRNAALDSERERLESMQERLQQEGDVMTEVQLRRLERDIRNLSRYVQRSQEDIQDEFQFRLSQEMDRITEIINETIATLAQEQGYDFVLSRPVLYASDDANITDEVFALLQQEFSASANSTTP